MKRCLSFISVLLVWCSTPPGCTHQAENAQFSLKEFVRDSTINSLVVFPIDSLLPYDGLSLLPSRSNSIDIVYCLNSSRSFCIAEYLLFCENAAKAAANVNIWTLSSAEDKDLVLFYIERWQLSTHSSHLPIVIPLSSHYPYRDTLLGNDAFLIHDNKIIASIDNHLMVHQLK